MSHSPTIWEAMPARRDLEFDFIDPDVFSNVERFIVGEEGFSTSVELSSATARAVAAPDGILGTLPLNIYIEGVGELDLTLTDDAGGWTHIFGESGDPVSTWFNATDLVFLTATHAEVDVA